MPDSTDAAGTDKAGTTDLSNSNRKSKSLRRRVAFTNSKLAAPDSPVYHTASQFQRYMHLPDPLPLYALLSAVAGNMLTGEPAWLMLVGASGGGKTALLKSLKKIPYLIEKSSIKGEAALLSGVKKKDRTDDATGGVLRELQWGETGPDVRAFGAIVFREFTSILSLPRDQLKLLLGYLREVYDGRWSRDIGGEGGRMLHWEGKIGMFAGVTHVIDRYAEEMALMGYRFVYFRFPETDGTEEARHAANVTDGIMADECRADIVSEMFDGLGLSFKEQTKRRRLHPAELERIVALGQLGTRVRATVQRENWGQTREVIEIPRAEIATRMTQELTQTYLGGEVIGLDEEDRWKVVGRIALDSAPLTRTEILRRVIEGRVVNGQKLKGGKPLSDVIKTVACGETTVRRELENLELLKVVERSMSGGWRLTEWAEVRAKGL